jgi:hypothetical protein
MMFNVFSRRPDAHVLKSLQYVQEARLSVLEHRIAAEHHAALAEMYARRVEWLEQEFAVQGQAELGAKHHAAPSDWAHSTLSKRQTRALQRKPSAVVSWLRSQATDRPAAAASESA